MDIWHNGLYGLNSPKELFMKAQSDLASFYENPNEWLLFNLVCTLNHLRDWIYPEDWETYKNIPEEALTPSQRFHRQLHYDADYNVIRDLCNNAKHFKDCCGIGPRTWTVDGARAGIMRAGDRLDQRYFLVENKDLRTHLFGLVSKYHDFFNRAD